MDYPARAIDEKLLILTTLFALVACGSDESEPKHKAPAPAPAPTGPERPSIEQALDAGLRGHPHAIKICYDTKFDGFLVYYDKGDPADPNYGDAMHGWYKIQVDAFYPSSNGTWFITPQDGARYVTVYPDDTNLPCKARTPGQ